MIKSNSIMRGLVSCTYALSLRLKAKGGVPDLGKTAVFKPGSQSINLYTSLSTNALTRVLTGSGNLRCLYLGMLAWFVSKAN